MMKECLLLIIYLTIFISLFPGIFPILPVWNFDSQSIDLFSSSSTYEYIIYHKNSYEITVLLKKTINKINGVITSKNLLTIGSTTKEVAFEDIDSHYKNKLDHSVVICPKGKFHPYDFDNDDYIIPQSFEEKSDWNLRCYYHDTGHFFIFYLMNENSYFYSFCHCDSDPNPISFPYLYQLYDFLLENGNKENNYRYKFPVIKNDGSYIFLQLYALITNSGEFNVNIVNLDRKSLIPVKQYSQAQFVDYSFFVFFTYDDIHSFQSGYSSSNIDLIFNSNVENIESLNSVSLINNIQSPFSFIDNIEIKEMKFISGTKYVYYKILNLDKGTQYYGLLDIQLNKVLYNIEGEFVTFIPYSEGEIIAITPSSAYKICIIKDGNSCFDTCSSNNLISDIEGNKCQSGCDNGKIMLMPEGICINKNICDLNIFVLNADETQCGLCSYFYPNGAKYKLINSSECTSTIPNNTEFYNEELLLLKCKNNYHSVNDICIPDFCFERCESCLEISNDINNQKCISCKEGFYLDEENCLVYPIITTINNIISTTTNITNEYTSEIPDDILCQEGNFLSNDNICINCTNLCKNYESNSCNCTSCKNGYDLNKENKICIKCGNLCEKYKSNSCNCLTCPINYGLVENKCIECKGCKSNKNQTCECSKCFQGYYLDSNYNCKQCQEFCPSYEENTCKCINEYSFYGFYKGINQTIYILKTNNLTNVENIILDEIRNKLKKGEINSSLIEDGFYFYIESPKTNFIISKSTNKIDITTTINLGECEDKLRSNKTLTNNDSLYILYAEVMEDGMKVPRTEYEVYYNSGSNEFHNLDLEICNNIRINKSISVNISEKDIDKYNSSSEYYNDICYTYTSDNGTDITLKDRRNEYINNNMSLCEDNCLFIDYDLNTGKAICSCPISVGMSHISDNKIDKERLKSNFINFKNIANIEMLKCYHLLFSKDIIKNIGCIIISLIFFIESISVFLFYCHGYNIFKSKINEMINNKNIDKKDNVKNENSDDKTRKTKEKKINKDINNDINIFEKKNGNKKTDVKKKETKNDKKKSSKIKSKNKSKHFPPKKSKKYINKKDSNNIYDNNKIKYFSVDKSEKKANH